MAATFALPEGAVTAYLPDDVASGETFSGTVDGPDGFVLTFGDQRARTGEPFSWAVPSGESRQQILITLLDRQGSERARAWLQTGAVPPRDAAFRFPPLVQAGKPFPVRGSLDGDFRTTRVEINGAAVFPLAESTRRVIVRAPGNLIGPASATLTEAGIERRGAMRSLSIEMTAPAGERAGDPRTDGAGREQDRSRRAAARRRRPSLRARRRRCGAADRHCPARIQRRPRRLGGPAGHPAVAPRRGGGRASDSAVESRRGRRAPARGRAQRARLRRPSGGRGDAGRFRHRPCRRVRHAGGRRAARLVARPRIDTGLGNRHPVPVALLWFLDHHATRRGRRTPRRGRPHCASSTGSCPRPPRSWRCTSSA